MSPSLSQTEIKKRLIRLSNLERLHMEQGKRLQKYIRKYNEVKEENLKLKQTLETVLIQVAELREKIFGKKRMKEEEKKRREEERKRREEEKKKEEERNQDNHNNDKNGSGSNSSSPKTKHSRSLPKKKEITETKRFSVSRCKHCNDPLCDITKHIRYEEDVLLPILENISSKKVLKKIIERGYCKRCGNFTSGSSLRGEVVSLGRNVQMLVSYMSIILDCSYSQIRTFLLDHYGFPLSEGEISILLEKEHFRMLPILEQIKENVRGAPVKHLDETSWKVHSLGSGYAWVMADSHTADRVYLLASGRGKGNAETLLSGSSGIRVTDCFPAYKNMKGEHQVCWAHFWRKIRDLSENANLPEKKRSMVWKWRKEFSAIYETLRETIQKPFDKKLYQETEQELRTKLSPLLLPNAKDPKKLKDLKNTIQVYSHAIFTCLKYPNVPCDNNRAERDIRKLVIKRKKSFGSATEKGANVLSTLLSVYWSYRERYRENLFLELGKE